MTEIVNKIHNFVKELGGNMALSPPCYFVDCHFEGDDNETKGEKALLVGWIASLNPLQTNLIQDPGEYMKEEEEFKAVILERNSKPIFESSPIVEKIPIWEDNGFRIKFGNSEMNFGGGRKISGYKDVNCGNVHKLIGEEVTEKTAVMKRKKMLWYDGKTITFTPWEVIDEKISVKRMEGMK